MVVDVNAFVPFPFDSLELFSDFPQEVLRYGNVADQIVAIHLLQVIGKPCWMGKIDPCPIHG